MGIKKAHYVKLTSLARLFPPTGPVPSRPPANLGLIRFKIYYGSLLRRERELKDLRPLAPDDASPFPELILFFPFGKVAQREKRREEEESIFKGPLRPPASRREGEEEIIFFESLALNLAPPMCGHALLIKSKERFWMEQKKSLALANLRLEPISSSATCVDTFPVRKATRRKCQNMEGVRLSTQGEKKTLGASAAGERRQKGHISKKRGIRRTTEEVF